MSKTKMVVADKFQLGRAGKNFKKELRGEAIRTNQVVTREWAEQCNESFEEMGIWYEIDEDATADYYGAKKEVESVDSELEKAKKDYEEIFGKKPFHSWDYDKIVSKIREEVGS